jgi:hypothetical protein
MNTQKMQLAGLVLAMGLSGAAQAEIFTNDVVAGTPFSVTLDTGTPPWTGISPFPEQTGVDSYDTGLVTNLYVTAVTNSVTNTVVTPAQIGIDGSINTYGTRTTSYDSNVTQTQSAYAQAYFDGYGYFTAPAYGNQSYLMSGQIENLVGSNLINNGVATVSPIMGLALSSWSGSSVTLSFRMGTDSSQLATIASRTYSLSELFLQPFNNYEAGVMILDPGSFSMDLTGINYFEAEWSFSEDAYVNIASSFLGLSGTLESATPVVYDHTETLTGVLFSSEVIPALPVPVPEPETYAMMLAGLGLVGMMAKRRKS